jgi:quinolinate synthase
MGVSLKNIAVWDFSKPQGGLDEKTINQAKIILWKGFCSVHQLFDVDDIEKYRKTYPEGKVISHPECSFEVCQQSDEVGSTEYIIKVVKASPPGSRWLVGTELNLVNRLRHECEAEGKFVHFMGDNLCACSTMFRIDPQHLLWTLENLVHHTVVNQISVPLSMASLARLALERMLAIS